MPTILAVSGSLRRQSTNTLLLHAAARLASPSLPWQVYEDLERIPPFNPDRLSIPGPVQDWQAALTAASAIVISTPEYAHGLPGTLKNALDWVVGTAELSGKPVALLNASARAVYAQAALREVLKTMNANVLTSVEMTISLLGSELITAEDILTLNTPARELPRFVAAFERSVRDALPHLA